jgi:uncharacterized protein
MLLLIAQNLSLWDKTSGTWINIVTVLIGSLVGLILKDSLPLRMQRIITQGLGLLTLFLGLMMAGSLFKVQVKSIDGAIIGLIAIVIGGIIGEWCQLEQLLHDFGNQLRKWFRGSGKFSEGFVAATLLFCVGPMAIIGSLNNGLTGNNSLLSIKSAMDGLAAIALTASYGIGVAFSSAVILLYQGSLSIAAASLTQNMPDPATAPSVLLTSGVGGLIIMGLGMNLLEITQLSIAAFLPALIAAPLLCAILQQFP